MMKALGNVALILFLCTEFANSTAQTIEHKEAASFMQKMYSYSTKMFEGRLFDGKDNPQKQCLLLKEFFVIDLLSQEDARWHGCDLQHPFIRFPRMEGDEFEYNDNPAKDSKIKFSKPIIEGDKAMVAVTSKYGRAVFFLTKTDKGLRVENALYYLSWPADSEVCTSNFLAKPTPWQKKAEQPVCNR